MSTRRDLRLRFLGPVEMRSGEQLSEAELAELLERLTARQKDQP